MLRCARSLYYSLRFELIVHAFVPYLSKNH